jgi:LPXTG-motif cell wall-anchored protein
MMQQRSRRRGLTAIGLGSIVAGALVLAGAFPGNAGAAPTQAQTPSSSVVEGNPNCGDLGEFDFEFKIDEQPVAGMTYDDPDSDLVITITEVVEGDPMTFSFESNIPVSAVFVKSGPGGILYTFDPPTTTGTDLASPNDSISHVSFCWNEDQGTTTTTAKDTTTTTEAGSTTTSSVVPTSVSVPTTVSGATTATTQRGGLPRTGSNTGPALAIGAGLLAGGVALVAATRRYRQS